MLKFFRQIRQKLLHENQFSKYLLYAAGEVILVMLGILLAFQVSNWNEVRKKSQLELGLLKGLSEDLQFNLNDLKARLYYDSITITSGEQLLVILQDQDSEYEESMEDLFGWIEVANSLKMKTLAYENLKSNGLSIITNDSLRKDIAWLYDSRYGYHDDQHEALMAIFNNGIPIHHKYLRTKTMFKKVPNDFQALKQSEEFLNYLTHTIAIRKRFRSNTNFSQERTNEIKDRVDREIHRLEK